MDTWTGGFDVKIALALYKACQKRDNEFVSEIYRELLNRESSQHEHFHYVPLLSSGTPLLNIISEILHTQEALERYTHPQGTDGHNSSIADKLHTLFSLPPGDYVEQVYKELLLRTADEAGYSGHLNLLENRLPRMDVFTGILLSEEFRSLLHSRDSEHMHIDTNIHILTGRLAQAALELENDQAYLTDTNGILKVTYDRWITAQKAERTHWMVGGLGVSNDRNDEHFEGFDGYKALAGMTFPHAIELGCGPFTNMRLIGNVCCIQEASLLDPMIGTYLSHPNCSYTSEVLHVENKMEPEKTIRIQQLIESPIEKMPTDTQYDLAVIINVIEHCYDIEKVFHHVSSTIKQGGYIVFHDKMYNHQEVVKMTSTLFDAAHPLRVEGNIIHSFLDKHFVPVYSNIVTHPVSTDSTIDFLYYVGVKK